MRAETADQRYPKLSRLAVVAAMGSISLAQAAWSQTPRLELLDAVRSTLLRHPLLENQRAEVELSRGARQIASSIFNPVLQSQARQDLTNTAQTVPVGGTLRVGPGNIQLNRTDYSAAASKLFRNGITVTPFASIDRATNGFAYPGGLNTSALSLSINIPLLRGRGTRIVTARERAAELEIRASQYDLDFLLSSLSSNTAQDYWQYVAAQKLLEVAMSAQARGQLYVENTQALIDAEHAPRSDINQVSANLAQRMAGRIAAQNAVVVARQRLAQSMGRSATEILEPIGAPEDDFPAVPSPDSLPDASQGLQRHLSQALGARPDYLAAQNRKEQFLILLPAAENRLRPGLDVSFVGGYQGLRSGRGIDSFLASPFVGVRGPTVGAALTYSYPVGNEAAKGGLRQTQASIRQSEVAVLETAREISRSITVAIESVRNAILRVEKANLAVSLAQEALAGAKEKYRAGIGSVVEILQVEDRLNAALGDQVQARLAYALALIQYRFSLGTLLPSGQQIPEIRREVFFELESANR